MIFKGTQRKASFAEVIDLKNDEVQIVLNDSLATLTRELDLTIIQAQKHLR